MRRRPQVLASRDQRDALQRIVVGDAKMIAGRCVLAGQDDVAEWLGAASDGAFARCLEGQDCGVAACCECLVHMQPQSVRLAGSDAGIALVLRQPAARAWVARHAIGRVRSGGGLLDVGAAAKAGVEQAARRQPIKRGAILGEVLRLHPHLAIPVEAEPGQVLEDRRGELRTAARPVDVFQAEQEPAAGLSRAAPGEQRAERVAEMQVAGGAWREAGDDRHGTAAQGSRVGGKGRGAWRSSMDRAGDRPRRWRRRSLSCCATDLAPTGTT